MSASFFHKAPAFAVCLSFILGILIQQRPFFSDASLHLVLGLVFLLVFLSQFKSIRQHSLLNLSVLILSSFFFVIAGHIRREQVTKDNDFESQINADFSATVLFSPIEKDRSYRLDLAIDSALGESAAWRINTKAIAYMEKSPAVLSLLPGQRIRFSSTLKPPSGRMNPEDFDYRAYLKRKGFFATCYISADNWRLLDEEVMSLKIAAARAQNHVLNILKGLGYGDEELALISALTVGYKELIEDEQRYAYIAAGTTHVLAVSGLHVGIIFMFLSRLFKVFGKGFKANLLRTLLIILLLWCFAFITGLSPSVSRASLMFSLMALGRLGKHSSSIFNTIFLSAFILLFIDPRLLFDIGFQLSYTAVLGIVTFEPYLTPWLGRWLSLPKVLRQLIAVSIAAQIGTAPISIHVFNCFPTYFILSNVWAIPLVALIVNGAIVLILMALAGLPVGFIAIPLEWLLIAMNKGMKLISALPYSLSTFLYLDKTTVLFSYLILLTFLLALSSHSKRYLQTSLLLCILALGYNSYTMERRRAVSSFFVFNEQNTLSIAMQQGLVSDYFLENDTQTVKMPSYFIHHHLARETLRSQLYSDYHKNHNLLITKDFIITPKRLHAVYSPRLSKPSGKISINTLIINKEEPESIYQLYEHLKFDCLVLRHKPGKHINYYLRFCEKHGVKLHKIYEDGAFVDAF